MKVQELLCRTMASRRGRPAWLFWIVSAATVLILVILGFFLHGGSMGLYMDDYSVKAWAFDFAAGRWKLTLIPFDHSWTMRPLTLLLEPNIANALPRHGLFVRIGIVFVHFLNACLLAKLGQRLSGSWLVGAVSGTLFLFPIFANEALLWFTAALSNAFSLLFLLLGFHLLLSCRSFENFVLLICGIASWFLMITFYESGLLIILLLPAFFVLTQNEARRTNPKLWIAGLAGSFIPISSYLKFVELKSPDVIARGGASFNVSFLLWHKVPEAAEQVWWLLTDWGVFGPLHEAFTLGKHLWSAAPGGQALIIGAVGGICYASLLFPAQSEPRPSLGRLLNLMLVGAAWSILGLLPIVLIRNQIVEIRTLYIPSAGFALSAAALLAAIVEIFQSKSASSARAVLAGTGAVALLSSLTMAGLIYAYQLRWDLDQRQLEALNRIMPMISPTDSIWLLPVGVDEKTVGKAGGAKAS